MSNSIRCIDQRFAFKNSGISCLALISNLKNPNTKVLNAKNWLQVAKYDESYTVFFEQLIWTNGLVVKTWCRESGDMGSILEECWNPLPSLGHFAWNWASQCTDTRAFYVAVLSISFLLLGFCQWRSRADRVVNLNTTIRLPLLWRTWTRALAQMCGHGT